MTVHVARTIPFHPQHCPDCQHYHAEINRCRAFAVESWPKPLLGIFSGESQEHCENFRQKMPATSSASAVPNETSILPTPGVETASPLTILPAEFKPPIEPRIHCLKCKAENLPDHVRCTYCRADLLPGEGLGVRLVTFLLSLLVAGFFGRLAYILVSEPTRALGVFDDPVKPALFAAATLVSGIWFLFRKTPRHSRLTGRADRHLALNLSQALRDYTRALEIAPKKERAEILRKRAAAYEKLGLQDEATRDQIAYTYEQGAYAFGSALTGIFGGDREQYALNRSKSERAQLLSAGRAVALGYCSRCKDAIELTQQLHCPLHPRAKIQETRLFLPSEMDKGRKWILEALSRQRLAWLKVAARWAVILLLLWFPLTILYRQFVPESNSPGESQDQLPGVVGPSFEEVTEDTFEDGGISFAYPSDWKIVTSTDRQELLRTSLEGLSDYEYIGGVYTGGVDTCESCAHMVLVTVQSPEEGPLTLEQYDLVRAEAQSQMGSRLLDHQLQEFNGVPAAVSKYIGLSQETQQWDVILLVPGENQVVMFSCSARRNDYDHFEPVFQRAMETLFFEVAQTGLSTPTNIAEQKEVQPTEAIAIVDRSGSSINVRSGPGTEYSIVGGLPRDSKVEVLGRNQAGNWLKIAEPPGWIYAELVTLSIPVESLPVVE